MGKVVVGLSVSADGFIAGANVVTHDPPTEGEWSDRVTFVPEGLDRALELAQDAAGDRKVSVSAASVTQQLLRVGKLDEIDLNVVPCLLGAGVRLLANLDNAPIDLERVRVIPSDGVTHVRYRVVRS
jgi:dihydrofolate reductase